MKIEENNKLIAEFMGLKTFDANHNWYITPELVDGSHEVHINDLSYDSSWDWLMPVVEKIETIPLTHDRIGHTNANVRTGNFNVCIEYQGGMLDYVHGLSGQPIKYGFDDVFKLTRIEATYKAVVDFIKWYNKNK